MTGATRGAGRGIAVSLGEAGATVYCTGRTTRERRSEYDRPETIEETAELVDAAGGTGIAVEVDHLEPAQVEALVERIDAEQGRLDVLVNDIWGGEKLAQWNTPVWEHDLDSGLRMLRLAIDTHLITSHFALALLIRRPGGLVVEMTDGTLEYNAANYRLSTFYDLAKTAVIRLAFAQSKELAPHGCTAVALTPGWMRSEMMLDIYGVTEANWREATVGSPHFVAISETPRFVGRAVAALAADPQVHDRNGGSFSSGGLAREYGFTDLDGSQPDCWRYMVEVQDPGLPAGPDRLPLRLRRRAAACAPSIQISQRRSPSGARRGSGRDGARRTRCDACARHLREPTRCAASASPMRPRPRGRSARRRGSAPVRRAAPPSGRCSGRGTARRHRRRSWRSAAHAPGVGETTQDSRQQTLSQEEAGRSNRASRGLGGGRGCARGGRGSPGAPGRTPCGLPWSRNTRVGLCRASR